MQIKKTNKQTRTKMHANWLGHLYSTLPADPQTHTLLPFSLGWVFAKDSLENMTQERQDQAGVAGTGNGHLFLRLTVSGWLVAFPARRVAESNYMRKLIRPSN